jgi:phosphopantothenoylcysteine decarboxylase/phosphopantothenate--cysteine ligase
VRYLITAGPTREPIDEVRYLSNHSSGKLGFAIARAAARLGHEVTLVHGPVCLRRPAGVETVAITTGAELAREVQRRADRSDVCVMAAAVADFAPRRRRAGKIKKGSGGLTLDLRKTRDILAALGRHRRPGQLLVGFALEAADPDHRLALAKLRRKRCDLIVANQLATMGADTARLVVLDRNGVQLELQGRKATVARRLVSFLDTYHQS